VTVDQILRVLLVDDDRPFRQMTRAVLESDVRFEIVGEASNGIQALLLVERLEPDAVLVDLDIPALTGIELVRLLGESRPEVRVVVVTGSDDPADQAAAIRCGARKVLTKCAASVAAIGDALVAD
jgi:two-component system nitrate/nitrite response regulator NarL